MTTTQFQEDRKLLAEVNQAIAATNSYEMKRLRALYLNCFYLFGLMKNCDCRNYVEIYKIARRTERRLRQMALAHAGQAA